MQLAVALVVLAFGLIAFLLATVAPTWWGTIVVAAAAVALAVAVGVRVKRWKRGVAVLGGLLGVWVLLNAGFVIGGW